jgi:hypothetical protein
VIRWSGVPNQQFRLEQSRDLLGWEIAPAQSLELSPGEYQATIQVNSAENHFFRLKGN